MTRVALGLGCSLGDRLHRLERTLRRLDATPGLRWERTSALVRTPPLRGGAARGAFLNAVALFRTRLEPLELLEVCVALEDEAGRRRARRWGDRTLDLDVLLYDGQVVHHPRLTVPHPAIALRPFVLGPLLEVWPDAVDPVTGVALASLPAPSGPRPVAVARVARHRPLAYL